MSFWSTIGDIFTKTGNIANPSLAAYDMARAAGSVPEGQRDDFVSTVTKANPAAGAALKTFNSEPVQNVIKPIAWVGNQADHALATLGTGIDAQQAQGRSGWSVLWDNKAWDDAWSRTENTSFEDLWAESFMHSEYDAADRSALVGHNFTPDSQQIRDTFEKDKDKLGFKVASGAMGVAATWYADPTLVLGKAAKIARAGDRIIDAAHADEIANAIPTTGERGLGSTLAGKAKSSPQETASRLYAQVAKTDNMDLTSAAAHFKPMLERSGDTAPIVGLLGQAGRISDVGVQRAVKADVILAAAGSAVARDRLISSAPDIARALQRSASAPEQFKIVDDMVAAGLSGKALTDAAKAWASKGNKAELKAYAKDLDNIHTRIAKAVEVGAHGGVEAVSPGALGVMKLKYRAGMAHEFFYQPGPHSRMVRVVHWATGQRMNGVIDVSDAVRGHDELMDTMTRSGLFSGAERKRMSEKWWSAPTKDARASIAHSYPTFMLAKLAEKHGLSKSEMQDVLKQYGDWHQSARTYVTKQMEEARLGGATRVTLEDPGTGVPNSIDRGLFEKHVADSAPVPNVDQLERLVLSRKQAASVTDKVRGTLLPAWHTAEDANDIWRTLTLARPGFIARTQFDTQARSLVAIGATNIVADAMRGLGHKLSDKLTGAQVQRVTDVAETMVRRDALHAQAAELRRQAELVPNGSGAALLKRADALEAKASEDVTNVITGKHIATDERGVDLGNGVKVRGRAVGSDVERQRLAPALHSGSVPISDAILRTGDKMQAQIVEHADNWMTVMPDSPDWARAWLRSKDALVSSPSGRKILEVLDLPNADAIKALRESPEVRNAWRELRNDGNPDFNGWLDRAISQAEWTAPTPEVRQALLSGKVLDRTDAESLFRKVGDDASPLPDRMPVHAPAMDVINPLKQRHNLMDLVRKSVRWMSDQPDTVLGRVPFYTERYFKHFEELGRREVDRTGELGAEARLKIEKVARHRAIQDTRQTMYDTARFTGAHDKAARMTFAFLGAWEDSMRAWGRMFYDDPARIGKLVKTWYAPDRAGFIVDENGDKVKPGDSSREKWIVLPFAIPGTQVTEFKLRKDSFNSMFQGEVPWAPGFSPMVQVPVTQIAARAFPEIADPNYKIGGVAVGDNPILRQMFGFGLPKPGVTVGQQASSVAGQFTPGYVKRFASILDGNSQQFADAYSMGLNAALVKAREDGKDVNSKEVQKWADAQATKTARSMTVLEFASNFGLGLSGEGATKADFYRERYREISANSAALKAAGSSVEEEFLKQHPEAAGLKWSFTSNGTGVNATLAVEDRSRKYGKDISANPDYGWFYIGSDNVGGEFSSAVYSSQYGREAAPGSGEAWRSRQTPADIRKATNSSLGWDAYNQISTQIDLQLEARGLTSVQQKGAEDLAAIKKQFKEELGAENPDWFKDYSSFDPSKLQTFLDQVAKPALKDERLKDRSDIKAMGDYLDLRQEAMNLANANGFSLGSKDAAPLRAVLADTGAQMARENIGFSQMWNRVLQREVGE